MEAFGQQCSLFSLEVILQCFSDSIFAGCRCARFLGTEIDKYLQNAGLAFILGRERFALFIATAYSVYCAWMYVGWLGLTLALNLSFVSSEVLLIILSDKINEQRENGSAEQRAGFQGESGFFSGESMHTSASVAAEHDLGTPSACGSDPEATPESEIVRLLNCRDHYTALGFSRFGNIDLSVLKREYRKKVGAILHLFDLSCVQRSLLLMLTFVSVSQSKVTF